MPHSQRTWIELSASALRHNLQAAQRVVGKKVGILPIVKANAYGHGLEQLLPIIRRQPITGLGVAYGTEALALRKSGFRKRVIVLSSWEPHDLAVLLDHQIELTVWDLNSLALIVHASARRRKPPKIHLKLDTGTTRIGFRKEAVGSLQTALKEAEKHVQVVGVFSHLANAEEQKSTRTNAQINYFTTLNSRLQDVPGERHLACTAAALRYPKSRLAFVRLGIGLYGLWPAPEIAVWARRSGLRYQPKPILSWYTHLQQVKTIPTGTSIGYGSTVRAKKTMRIGILPVGYSDGYPRSASNQSHVMIGGKPAEVVGRISMNLLAVNLRRQPNARPGDRVTLLGKGITADTLAEQSGSLHYELVSRIAPDIPRFVVT